MSQADTHFTLTGDKHTLVILDSERRIENVFAFLVAVKGTIRAGDVCNCIEAGKNSDKFHRSRVTHDLRDEQS